MSYLGLDPLPRTRVKLVCRGCLAKEGKMFNLQERDLEKAFNDLTGLKLTRVHLCYVCLQLLRKCYEFRIRCLNTNYLIRQIHTLSEEVRNSIQRSDLQMNLGISKTLFINCESPQPGKELTRTEMVNVKDEGNSNLTEYLDVNSVKTEIFHHDAVETFDNDDNDFELPHDDFKLDFEIEDDMNINKHVAIVKEDNKKANVVEFIDNFTTTGTKEREIKTKKKRIRIKRNIVSQGENLKIMIGAWKRKKNLEGKSEEQLLVINISKIYIKMWINAKRNKDDMFDVFERMYELSLIKDQNKITTKGLSKQEKEERDIFLNFFDLNKKLSDIFNIDIEFHSLIKQRDEMNEKRKSCKTSESICCSECCRLFRTLDTRERHMMRAHNEKYKNKCEICLCTFRIPHGLRSHLLRTHATSMRCRVCSLLLFNQWDRAREHQKLHRGIKAVCKHCSLEYNDSKQLSMHMRTRHLALLRNAIDCTLCGDTLSGPGGLKMHLTIMHKMAVQCDTCTMWFVNQKVLEAHKKNGCNTNESACSVCGTGFPSEDAMKEHFNQHELYKCTRCNKSFARRLNYLDHRFKYCTENLTIQRKFNGNNSGKRKKAKPAIKKIKTRQKKTVVNDKMCEVCGKSFRNCAFLSYHQRIHTGERPYQCEYCDKRFRLAPALKVHLTTHTGERPYKCTLCPAAFRQHPHLQVHIRSHTNEKNYQCEICMKRFTARRTMLDHVRTVHEGMPPRIRKRNKKKESQTDDNIIPPSPTGDDIILPSPTGDDIIPPSPTGDDIILPSPTGDDIILPSPTGDDIILPSYIEDDIMI